MFLTYYIVLSTHNPIGYLMKTNNINEQQLQAEIDQLKIQFPQTRDLYREVCVLLFFRHGVTPTANKLYQLVRKGSMSAPSEALNKFWLELRDKSRISIESPDIPEGLKESVGGFVSAFWRQAQEAAAANFAEQVAESNDKIMQSRLDAETATKEKADVESKLHAAIAQLASSEQNLAEIEKKCAVNISTLAAQEKTLKTLLNERDTLARSLQDARNTFSQDLDKVNASLGKAEEQYRSLERKLLLEIERERQNSIKLEKLTSSLREASRSDQARFQKDVALLQNIISDLREKSGLLNGKLSEVTYQQREAAKRLKQTEKKLEACNSRLVRQTKPSSGKTGKAL